jgi:hypothetical protein
MKKQLIIIGGGISGMSLAFLSYKNFDVTLIESNNRLGGKIYGTFENGEYKEHSFRTFHTTYLALKYIMEQLASPLDDNKNLWEDLHTPELPNILSLFDKIKLYYKFLLLSPKEIEELKRISFKTWLEKNYKNKHDRARLISNVGILVAAREYSSAYEIYSMILLASTGKTLQPSYNYNNFLIDPLEKFLNKHVKIRKNTKAIKLNYENNKIISVQLDNNEILKGDIFTIATYKDDMYKLYEISEEDKLRWHSEVSCSFQIKLDNKDNKLGEIRNVYKLVELSPWHVVWYPYCNKTWFEDKYFKENKNIVILSIVVSDVNKEGSKIKKKLIDCSRDEVMTELLYQVGYDEKLIREIAIPDENGEVLRFGNNIKYNSNNINKWEFNDQLTINMPNKESLEAKTNVDNLFLAGEHVKSHFWEVPTMEQACESAFEAFRQIELSEGREYKIPYDIKKENFLKNSLNVLKISYRILRVIIKN